MARVNPYLTFNGNCEEAFNFYKSVFGVDFQMLMRFNDAPPEHQLPGDEGKKIMHVSMELEGGTWLMGSDQPASYGQGTRGDLYSISISAGSEKEARDLFSGLSAGGKISMPMDKVFWGSLFGMLTDKFGINWMISYDDRSE